MPPSSIMMLCILILCGFGSNILSFLSARECELPEENYPIEYPLEPMFVNYADIIQAIGECEDERSLKAAYIRIIIFEGCYSDSSNFTQELFAYLTEREEYINSIST